MTITKNMASNIGIIVFVCKFTDVLFHIILNLLFDLCVTNSHICSITKRLLHYCLDKFKIRHERPACDVFSVTSSLITRISAASLVKRHVTSTAVPATQPWCDSNTCHGHVPDNHWIFWDRTGGTILDGVIHIANITSYWNDVPMDDWRLDDNEQRMLDSMTLSTDVKQAIDNNSINVRSCLEHAIKCTLQMKAS